VGSGARPVLSALFLPHRKERHEQVTRHHGRLGGGGARPDGGNRLPATTFITSGDIRDGTVHKVDLSKQINRDLTRAEAPATAGTIYRVAHYAVAGSGAIATVACADKDSKSQK
jgi:hypothetical protein